MFMTVSYPKIISREEILLNNYKDILE